MRVARPFAVLLAVVLALALTGAAAAGEIFVSPRGTADGGGTAAKPLDLATAIGAKSPAKPGDTVVLLAGRYDGPMQGILRRPFELAVSGAAEKPVRIRPAPGAAVHFNGILLLTGSHVELIGVDLGDLQHDPTMARHRANLLVSVPSGTGAKLVNCNLFGAAEGVSAGVKAIDFEMRGCLVHDIGSMRMERVALDIGYADVPGAKTGNIFTGANQEGTKVLRGNILYRGGGSNIVLTGNAIQGFDIVDNICMLPRTYKGASPNVDNIMICGNYGRAAAQPLDRIRLIGNVVYQPQDVVQFKPNVRLSSYKDVFNGSLEIEKNVFIGGWHGLSLGRWKDLVMRDNAIWSTGVMVEISQSSTGTEIARHERPDLAGCRVTGNTYYANGMEKPFRYGVGEADRVTFAQWQQLGLDRNSKMSAGKGGRPTGGYSRLHTYPADEKGRAEVAIFDWDGHQAVDVDLSDVLAKGQPYRVYNCLDIDTTLAAAKPVLTGTYDGGDIAFPMSRSELSPDFDAFLVLPVAEGK